jgi:hypothetical protein
MQRDVGLVTCTRAVDLNEKTVGISFQPHVVTRARLEVDRA